MDEKENKKLLRAWCAGELEKEDMYILTYSGRGDTAYLTAKKWNQDRIYHFKATKENNVCKMMEVHDDI